MPELSQLQAVQCKYVHSIQSVDRQEVAPGRPFRAARRQPNPANDWLRITTLNHPHPTTARFIINVVILAQAIIDGPARATYRFWLLRVARLLPNVNVQARSLDGAESQPHPPSFFNTLSRPSIPMPIPNPVRIRRRLAAPHRTGSKLSPPLGEVVRSRSSRRYEVATL